MSEAWFYDHLACPDCHRDFDWCPDRCTCVCGFAAAPARPTHFRPQKPQSRTLQFALQPVSAANLASIDLARPPLTYTGPAAIRIGRALPILAPRKFFGWPARDKQ